MMTTPQQSVTRRDFLHASAADVPAPLTTGGLQPGDKGIRMTIDLINRAAAQL